MHLASMVSQRDELSTAIEELEGQLKWGQEVLVSRGIENAAE